MPKYQYNSRSGVKDYDSAVKWLAGAREKNAKVRTLYDYLYLERIDDDQIGITARWQSAAKYLLIYRSDGTTIIGTPTGNHWPYMRKIWMKYLPGVQVLIKKGILIISSPTEGISPANIKRCRTCDGYGLVSGHCYGSGTCFDDECEQNIERYRLLNEENVPWWDSRVKQHSAHTLCAHGKTNAHIQKRMHMCTRCAGLGKADYGSKRRGRLWDAKPIGFDKDLNYVELTTVEENEDVHSS
jgi:hypothetical protein